MYRLGIISLVLAASILQAQTIAVGDTLPDLSGTICSGPDSVFNFNDYTVAGGNPAIVLLTIFASW